MKTVIAIVAVLALGAPTMVLNGDKALVISRADIKTQLADLVPQAKPTGSAGPVVASYGNLGLMESVRTANGVGELHNNFDRSDEIVEKGSAMLITGGSLQVDPKPGVNGEVRVHERRGRRIEDNWRG